MNDTQKMFRTIVNGQSAMKSELLGEIKNLDKKIEGVRKEIQDLRTETKDGFKKLTQRADKIGLSVANLEDDCPTRDEFDELSGRVIKIENFQTI